MDEAIGELVGAISVDTSKTYNIVGVGSDKCVQPKGGNTGAGTEAVISTCSGGVAQRFQFITQSGGYYSIKNVSSGLCLDVTDASTSNGALIKQWSCSSGTYQQFLVEDTGGGTVKLTARHSGLVIDVIGGGTSNGTGLHQWGWGGSTNQTFKLVASGTAGGGEDPCAISLSDKPDGFAAQGVAPRVEECHPHPGHDGEPAQAVPGGWPGTRAPHHE
ncbi:RICIN domain-containing protein [Cystobacter fuscus]